MIKNLILLLFLVYSSSAFSQSGIQLGTNFDVNTALPLDSREKVSDLTERDAIDPLRRWEGMTVYVVDEGVHYSLVGGITNSDWKEAGGVGVEPFSPTPKDYIQYQIVLNLDDSKLYYAKNNFTSTGTFDSDDWSAVIAELPSIGNFEELSVEDLTIDKGLVMTDALGKLIQDPLLRLNVANNLLVPNSIFVKDLVLGSTDGVSIYNPTGEVHIASNAIDGSKFSNANRVMSTIGSNNYDVENLAKYPNFLEGSTDQYTCLACTPSIVVGGGVIAGTNSLKITHTTTSQLTFEAQTSGELGQYVTLNISVKTDTITHIVPVTDTIGDVTNEWILSPSNNYQTVTITYPMGATSTGFFVIPQDGGETEISQVHLKRANDRSFLVPNDASDINFPLTLSGAGSTNASIGNTYKAYRSGNRLFYYGQISWTGAGSSVVTLNLPSGITSSNLTSAITGMQVGNGQAFNVSGITGSVNYFVHIASSNTLSFRILSTDTTSTTSPLQDGLQNLTMVSGSLMRFNFSIPIDQWQSSSKVTPAECAFADKRKCENVLTLKYISGTTATDEFGNTYPVTKAGTNNLVHQFNITSWGLRNTPNCVATLKSGNNATVVQSGGTNNSNTLLSYSTRESTVGADLPIEIICKKTGDDIYYGPNYVASCENTISANEAMCGRDEINNKPIYRRTIQTTSAVSGASTVVAVLPTGLSLKNFIPYDANSWQYAGYWNANGSNSSWYVYYNQVNGNLTVLAGSAQTVRAGLQIPLVYTKP